jgi:hypothetical protein
MAAGDSIAHRQSADDRVIDLEMIHEQREIVGVLVDRGARTELSPKSAQIRHHIGSALTARSR